MISVPTPAQPDGAGHLAADQAAVHVSGLRKHYGDVVDVADLDLTVRQGEFFTLLGPSGSGKTTLLRLIAGFERPGAGRIELGGSEVTRVPPYARYGGAGSKFLVLNCRQPVGVYVMYRWDPGV